MSLSGMFAPMRVSSMAASDATTSSDPFWGGKKAPAPAAAAPQVSPRSKKTFTSRTLAMATRRKPRLNLSQTRTRQGNAAGARRPQCTHMMMGRLYGHHTCFMCGKVPGIGWVYVCQQDRELEQVEFLSDPDSFLTVPSESDYFEVQSRLAESLGMSASVVNGIRNRDYTLEQVDRLIEQKRHLVATIRKQENPSAEATPQSRYQQAADSIIASLGSAIAPPVQRSGNQASPVSTSAATDTPTSNSLAKKVSRRKQTCNFQVCHSCRPFFQDRLCMSFEKAMSSTVPAITEAEISHLPLLDPAIVRTLGLRYAQKSPPPTQLSLDNISSANLRQSDGLDEDTSDWTPTSATISECNSEKQDEPDPYPCPGAGVCPLWSQYSGCAYDSGFDDGLRALNHGFGPDPDLSRMTPENSLTRLRHVRGSISDTPGGSTSTGSSLSLPTPSTAPLTPLTPLGQSFEDALSIRLGKPGKAATICGPLMGGTKRRSGRLGLGMKAEDSSSSLGSEIEVEGGVALTEEAVETGVPDILTNEDAA